MSEVWSVSDPMVDIFISDRAVRTVDEGNLWVYSNEIKQKPTPLKKGTWCEFKARGGPVAFGYINPHSLISGRIVSRKKPDDLHTFLNEKLNTAMSRRCPLDQNASARLVFSEADLLPGLVLDCFSDVLVLQSNTAGIDAVLPLLEKIIPRAFKNIFGREPKAFVMRGDASVRLLEGLSDFVRVVIGEESDLKKGSFLQEGVRYGANFLEGQKTGFFLDQRDNRQFLRVWLKNQIHVRILDLFCYSGGWGLSAIKSGAEHVTFVDQSAAALDLVRQGMEDNQIGSLSARIVESDVFDFLEADSTSYDVVVVDPPAFVKSKKNLPQALRAYEKLNRLAWLRVKPGGLMISCSCSYHISETDFFNLLSAAVAKTKGMAHVVFRGGQSSDHPVLLSMPETKYLKCVALRKL